MALRESGEDYLESIYVLSERQGIVRSIDVAEYLGVTKASEHRLRGDGQTRCASDGTRS